MPDQYPEVITIDQLSFVPYLHQGQIRKRVLELSFEINEDYKGKNPFFVVVLNGAFVFAADLLRCMPESYEMGFLKVSSYDKMDSKELSFDYCSDMDLEGREVIIIEDIVDTGRTMKQLIPYIKAMGATNVTIATLLFKPDKLQYALDMRYVGFEIPNQFVVGYGLDYDEQGRNLKHIYQLRSEV